MVHNRQKSTNFAEKQRGYILFIYNPLKISIIHKQR